MSTSERDVQEALHAHLIETYRHDSAHSEYWWRADCRCQWYTEGSEPNVEMAAYDHISDVHMLGLDKVAPLIEAAARADERAKVAEEQAAREAALTAANRKIRAALIAVADRLDVPFTDVPELSAWGRYVKPALERLDAAIRMGQAANGPSVAAERRTAPPEGSSNQDGGDRHSGAQEGER